eukprot:1711280-Amphidinium_carterae.1
MVQVDVAVTRITAVEFLAVARALEKCQPRVIVSDCKGVVKRNGCANLSYWEPTSKGRNGDLEKK